MIMHDSDQAKNLQTAEIRINLGIEEHRRLIWDADHGASQDLRRRWRAFSSDMTDGAIFDGVAFLGEGAETRVFVSTAPVDFRKGVHGIGARIRL